MTRALPRWALPGLVGTLAFATYTPSLGNGFALDDVPAVAQDTRIRTLSAIPRLIGSPYLTYMPPERSPYRPVTTVSYAISWALGGGHPAAFHAVNVLLHVAATLLFLSLLTALGAGVVPAALAAALFATHPVHVEAVAGVVGRADVLAALLCLLALRIHLGVRLAPPTRIALVAAAYLLALGSKESAVVLPVLVLLVDALRGTSGGRLGVVAADAWGPGVERGVTAAAADAGAGAARGVTAADATGPRFESGVRHEEALGAQAVGEGAPGLVRRLLATWPTHAALATALAIFLAARTAVLGGIVQLDVASYIVALPAGLRATTAVANLAEIARLLVFPLDLSPEYGPAVITPSGLGDARFWTGVACVGLAVGVGAVGLRRGGHGDWLALGAAWVAVAFALLSNLILPMPMWIAERTLYLPSVGIGFLVVGVVGLATEDRSGGGGTQGAPARAVGPARAVIAVGLVACLLGAAHSGRRSTAWRDDAALLEDLVERHPESFRAQWALGGRMVDAGDVDGGLVWLDRAVETHPNSLLLTLDHVRALLLAGRSAEAEERVRPISPAAHPSRSVFLAQSLIFQGRDAEAAEVVREGLSHFPGDPRMTEQARALGIGG